MGELVVEWLKGVQSLRAGYKAGAQYGSVSQFDSLRCSLGDARFGHNLCGKLMVLCCIARAVQRCAPSGG
jgi:hypothetical protein